MRTHGSSPRHTHTQGYCCTPWKLQVPCTYVNTHPWALSLPYTLQMSYTSCPYSGTRICSHTHAHTKG